MCVDKSKKFFAGYPFRIRCPRAPLKVLWDRRYIAVLYQLQLLVLVVDDLEKEHPAKLGDSLCVAINADVLAHYVLYGFDCIANRHKYLIDYDGGFVNSSIAFGGASAALSMK